MHQLDRPLGRLPLPRSHNTSTPRACTTQVRLAGHLQLPEGGTAFNCSCLLACCSSSRTAPTALACSRASACCACQSTLLPPSHDLAALPPPPAAALGCRAGCPAETPRAYQAADRHAPQGSLGRSNPLQTVLQQHCAFWDR